MIILIYIDVTGNSCKRMEFLTCFFILFWNMLNKIEFNVNNGT